MFHSITTILSAAATDLPRRAIVGFAEPVRNDFGLHVDGAGSSPYRASMKFVKLFAPAARVLATFGTDFCSFDSSFFT